MSDTYYEHGERGTSICMQVMESFPLEGKPELTLEKRAGVCKAGRRKGVSGREGIPEARMA